jgi:hypothetical protein
MADEVGVDGVFVQELSNLVQVAAHPSAPAFFTRPLCRVDVFPRGGAQACGAGDGVHGLARRLADTLVGSGSDAPEKRALLSSRLHAVGSCGPSPFAVPMFRVFVPLRSRIPWSPAHKSLRCQDVRTLRTIASSVLDRLALSTVTEM